MARTKGALNRVQIQNVKLSDMEWQVITTLLSSSEWAVHQEIAKRINDQTKGKSE